MPFLQPVVAESSLPLPLVHRLGGRAGRIGGPFGGAPPAGRPLRVAAGGAVNPASNARLKRWPGRTIDKGRPAPRPSKTQSHTTCMRLPGSVTSRQASGLTGAGEGTALASAGRAGFPRRTGLTPFCRITR